MPTHIERKILPYTTQQLFDLVGDVENYPAFLPWCLDCRITSHESPTIFLADLVIGYKFIREKFGSRVTLTPGDTPQIHVAYISGPMRYLSNTWKFTSLPDGTCVIDFDIDFEFKNALLEKLMGLFFHEAVRRMVSAFETHAHAIYGGSKSTER